MRRTRVVKIDPLRPEARLLDEAGKLLCDGFLVAFPTETVYGLGGNALDARAVGEIFVAKGRPREDPLIVHVVSAEQVQEVAADVPREADVLAHHFWPGPLTLLLLRAAHLPALVTAGLPTVAVRVPSHPVALGLLAAAGVPVAAPSANRFAHTSPTTAEHVLHDLEGRIDMVLDAGPTSIGIESTVLDVTVRPARLLRPGGVTREELERVLGQPVQEAQRGGAVTAPGQFERHYAPAAPLELFDGPREVVLPAIARGARDHLRDGKRVGLLLADDDEDATDGVDAARTVIARLGRSDDLTAIAHNLYTQLRWLDAQDLDMILSRTFGTEGLASAIADRLRRAAEGRIHRLG